MFNLLLHQAGAQSLPIILANHPDYRFTRETEDHVGIF